jgi:hypothetical protein
LKTKRSFSSSVVTLHSTLLHTVVRSVDEISLVVAQKATVVYGSKVHLEPGQNPGTWEGMLELTRPSNIALASKYVGAK